MKKSSCNSKENASGGGGAGRQPHWKHREPAGTTTVYVVHPAQFRSVVQQLTGGPASSPPPLSAAAHGRHHQGGGGGGGNGTGTGAAAAAGGANAAAQQQGRGEDGSSARTLGQMYQECMAWADADD
ncbi:unnamed protein product [Urochloa humidicola]